jgi:hypothetical protein
MLRLPTLYHGLILSLPDPLTGPILKRPFWAPALRESHYAGILLLLSICVVLCEALMIELPLDELERGVTRLLLFMIISVLEISPHISRFRTYGLRGQISRLTSLTSYLLR